jgi:hypothetical protein
LLLGLAASACVRDAVLENDVRSAQLQMLALATQIDLRQAEAAQSAQLVALEALYLRAPHDPRVCGLLALGYRRMADGFIEVRRLEALAAGDTAEATQQGELERHAFAKSEHYQGLCPVLDRPPPERSPAGTFWAELSPAEKACQAGDRKAYEQRLTELLARRPGQPEAQLHWALAQRLARGWLTPEVSARCPFR